MLGGAVGLAAWLVIRFAERVPLRRSIALTVLIGGAAGVLTTLLGGRMMAGSLVAITGSFPGSRLTLDAIGRSLGETSFGPVAETVTAGLEATVTLRIEATPCRLGFGVRWVAPRPGLSVG